jgi:putative transcriptional regulator
MNISLSHVWENQGMKARLAIGAGICAAVLLMAPAISRADDEIAEGKILVADRDLKDPNFVSSVVLVITYDERGTVGLIVNRESDTPVTKILDGVKEAAGRKDNAYEGGPLELKSVLALLRSPQTVPGTKHIFGDVYAVLTEDPLRKALSQSASGDRLRFYLGYAGWGPGQLEAEVDAGAWQILDGDAKAIFDAAPDTLWDRLTRRSGLRVVKNNYRASHVRLVTLQ